MNAPTVIQKDTTTAADFAAGLSAAIEKFRPQGNDAGKEGRRQLNRWRRTLCSIRGPDSTSRLVGLVLTRYMMNQANPTPSQRKLEMETGLSERTIGETLRRMVAQHWLVVVSKPGRGARDQGIRYTHSIPQKAHDMRKRAATPAELSSISRTAKPSSLDARTPNSVLKLPRNDINRNAVIGGAPC